MSQLVPPEATALDWVSLGTEPLPVAEAASWPVIDRCGAVVLFMGTVRDHSEGRSGVVSLDYEAYESEALLRMEAIAKAARERWPVAGRLVILHRLGLLGLGEVSVVTAASAPHRHEAFEIARYLIDTLKQTVPIWKRETWQEGSDWATCAHEIEEILPPGASEQVRQGH